MGDAVVVGHRSGGISGVFGIALGIEYWAFAELAFTRANSDSGLQTDCI